MANHRTRGYLTGFDVITTETPEQGSVPQGRNDYSLADLFLQLRELRAMFNEERIAYIEKLIVEHVEDMDNPHDTDLPKMGTSVEKELYNLWLEKGNEGNMEQFLKILFQYVKIASLLTTLEGKALDEVPSVYGVAQVIKRHDEDIHAHRALFGELFPGEEIRSFPTLAIDAEVGLPCFVEVIRNAPISYIDAFGNLTFSKVNELPEDYIHGFPMYPIFGEITNEFLHSENLGNSYWNKTNLNHGLSSEQSSILKNKPGFWILENPSEETQEHILAPSETFVVEKDEVFTISAYVKPYGRPCFGFRIPSAIFGAYPYVHFNMDEESVFINQSADVSRIHGEINPTASGYYKLSASFKALHPGEFIPEMYPIDIVDGDANYRGMPDRGVFIDCVSFTRIENSCPYIPTTNAPATLPATSVKLSLQDWYRKDQGTFIFQTTNPPHFPVKNVRMLAIVAKDNNDVAIRTRLPQVHNQRFYTVFQDSSNVSLNYFWSTVGTDKYAKLILGFDTEEHFARGEGGDIEIKPVETSINSNVTDLYIGQDPLRTNQFNGWIKRIAFYPIKCSSLQTDFFIGD